jgi:colanic acid/amylovoran biosynthesis glycosyltransferase
LDAEIVCSRPDIIHFEFGPLAVGRMYLRQLLGCKAVVSFRGYDLNFVKLDQRDYYRQIWQQADAIHLLGEDLWRRAQARGCPTDKPHVLIPPAIDVEFFTPQLRKSHGDVGTAERPLRILSVGRLVWKKGYEYGLEAVRLLLDQGVHCEYRVIGDGDYFEAVTFVAHQLGLTDRVKLLGELSPQEVKEQMGWADLFLHPAVSEGFCNAVLEAQAMTLPVVCTDADGLPENVVDGVTGFVVARRSPKALADEMNRLARYALLRERMGNVGRARIVKKFRLSDQIEAFERLYVDLLSSPAAEQESALNRTEIAHAG